MHKGNHVVLPIEDHVPVVAGLIHVGVNCLNFIRRVPIEILDIVPCSDEVVKLLADFRIIHRLIILVH